MFTSSRRPAVKALTSVVSGFCLSFPALVEPAAGTPYNSYSHYLIQYLQQNMRLADSFLQYAEYK
ncbi:MAG: hypothetical protein DBX36_03800 [Oscillospiraceae bacterium]|nr:MAG: hypothetical protein DBX36_03800 [Oscillospiraceae bacterium]